MEVILLLKQIKMDTPMLMFIINCIVLLISGGAAYIWDQTRKEESRRFDELHKLLKEEIAERKDEDKRLELIIDNKLSLAQFNEFKNSFVILSHAIQSIQDDIRAVLSTKR